MKENKIWNDYLPEDMQEHWTVYECLKESEDSSTFLVKETATGILCVLKWGRNRQTEFLRNGNHEKNGGQEIVRDSKGIQDI